MLNFAEIPAALGRMAWDMLKGALLGAAIPVALVVGFLVAGVLLLAQANGLPLPTAAAMVLGGLEAPAWTPVYLLAALPLSLAALALFGQWGLGWYKLLRPPAGRNGLLPALRWPAWLRHLAGRWLRSLQPPGPRRVTPAVALSPAHPHRTVLSTAAALSGAVARLN